MVVYCKLSIVQCACAIVLCLGVSGCASLSYSNTDIAQNLEATPFGKNTTPVEASRNLAAAKTAALSQNKLVLAVFGADWCHDSRALAGLLGTPRFTALTEQHYVVTFIDVGAPQQGEGRNLDLLARYGVTDVVGTPNLLVIDPANDAASRSEDAIYKELALLATTEIATD